MERLHIFEQIKIGMPVMQESNKEKIGTVKFVRFGEGNAKVELPEIDNIAETIADAFDISPEFPDEVYERLYSEGFIRVERSLKTDAIVLPSQIEHVVNGEVHISVNEDELLKE